MNTVLTNWEKDVEKFIKYLESISDITYRDFCKKTNPCSSIVLGIRVPVLRKIAKEIIKGDYHKFLYIDDYNIFEIKMLKAFVISNINDLDEYKRMFDEFIPTINDWAICDSFLGASKIIKKDRPYFFNYAKRLLEQDDEFFNRIAFVLLLNYFVDGEYILKIFRIIKNFRSDKYYASMGLAWLLCECFVFYPKETSDFLKRNTLDKTVIKYTIRKIKDSYRVPLDEKRTLSI